MGVQLKIMLCLFDFECTTLEMGGRHAHLEFVWSLVSSPVD